MQLNISYKHLDSSEAIETQIKNKSSHLKKYFQGRLDVDWVCSIDGQEHKSEVHVHAGHFTFHAHASDKNLYHTLDMALHKIEKQLSKKNELLKDKIHSHKKIGAE